MPAPRQLFLVFFCFLLLLGGPLHSQNPDIALLKSINPENPQAAVWKAASNSTFHVSGITVLGSLTYALIKNDKNLRYKSYELVIGIGINVLATDGLKTVMNRRRPADKYPGDVFVTTKTKGLSFPSGHTSLAFATATSLTLAYKKWYIAVPAYLWAGTVGYSRMYLGKHYPTDVLAGALVGAGSSVLSHWISKKLFDPKPATGTTPLVTAY